MNVILKLIKNPTNEFNLFKKACMNYSSKTDGSNHIAGHAFEVNPESLPVTKLNSSILKSFGKKSIELPKLDEAFAKNIETISSIDLSHEAITWIHIKNDGKILDWNYEILDKDHINNPDFNIAYEYLSKLYDEKLPKKSNAYLFEEKRYKTREAKMLQYILKLQKNEVILESLIKSKIMDQPDKKIFKMNSIKVAKKFNILVGNERVRAADLIQFMIKPKDNFHLDLSDFVLSGSDQYYDFFCKAKNQKEPLSINYLQASCFLNLIRDFDIIQF